MKISKPMIPSDLAQVDMNTFEKMAAQALMDEMSIEAIHCKGIQLLEKDFSSLCFRESVLENCRFNECDMNKTEFIDIRFISCDFSNCDFHESYFNRCEFVSCKNMGILLQKGILYHTLISDCNFRYANFSGSKLKDIRLTACDLSSASFEECKLSNIEIQESSLNGVNFFKTPLKGIDFRNDSIEGLILSGTELKGAIVTVFQAAELAKLLGVVIKEA